MRLTKKLISPMLALALGFSAMAVLPSTASAAWSCVPYARSVSDIDLKGDAWRWWSAANGVYAKGNVPRPGAVLVFRKTNDLRRGHVAVVRKVVSPRKVIIDHANWGSAGRKGIVDRNVAVIDISPANDWSMTRVWYPPVNGYGTTGYATYGFIYSQASGAKQSDRLTEQALRPMQVSTPISMHDVKPMAKSVPQGKAVPLPQRKPQSH